MGISERSKRGVKKIGKTANRVRVHFDNTSTETISNKFKRMLKNGIQQTENAAGRKPSGRFPARSMPEEKAQRSILHAFTFEKLCDGQTPWMFHIQA